MIHHHRSIMHGLMYSNECIQIHSLCDMWYVLHSLLCVNHAYYIDSTGIQHFYFISPHIHVLNSVIGENTDLITHFLSAIFDASCHAILALSCTLNAFLNNTLPHVIFFLYLSINIHSTAASPFNIKLCQLARKTTGTTTSNKKRNEQCIFITWIIYSKLWQMPFDWRAMHVYCLRISKQLCNCDSLQFRMQSAISSAEIE